MGFEECEDDQRDFLHKFQILQAIVETKQKFIEALGNVKTAQKISKIDSIDINAFCRGAKEKKNEESLSQKTIRSELAEKSAAMPNIFLKIQSKTDKF